jgi:hypothetical protein
MSLLFLLTKDNVLLIIDLNLGALIKTNHLRS